MTSGLISYVWRHHMALLALFVALGGSAYAATAARNSVTSKSIKRGAVKSADVKNQNLRGKDVRDDSLTGDDVDEATLRGVGTPGPAGPRGPAGAPGPPGQDGSPDTPAQVLSKLRGVDGPGSGLDADTLDGQSSASLVPLASTGAHTTPLRSYSYFMTTTSTDRYPFGQIALQAAGAAGQFRICGNTSTSNPLGWVLYLNGVRSTGTVAGNACTAAFDAGAGGDFQVTMRRSIVFGVHSGDAPTNENYNVYGFGQL